MSKIDFVAIVLILLLVFIVKVLAPPFPEPLPELEEVPTVEPAAPQDASYINPFDVDPTITLGPATIEKKCVDTHRLDTVSCADAEAIIRFRKAQNRILVEKLDRMILEEKKRILEEKYGLMEC